MSTLVITAAVVELPDGGIGRAIDKRVALARAAEKRVITLSSDAPFSVDLDGSEVNALVIETDTKITAKLTSTDGSQQSIPVDDLHITVSRSVAFTAIDLVRVAGQSATVTLTIGQKSP